MKFVPINPIMVQQEIMQDHEWEEFVSLGMEARADKDKCQWALGDLAVGVGKAYGGDSIGKYAYAVGVEKKTLMNYRTVSIKFPGEVRTKYQRLSFSHFAALVGVEKPEAWLERADDEDWTVEKIRIEVRKEYPGLDKPAIDEEPPEVYRCEECGQWRLRGLSSLEICRGHYHLTDKGMDYK